MASKDTIWNDVESTPTRLKLNIFKGIYDTCRTKNPVIDFLIFAVLYWLEERYIDYKIKVAIDIAEIDYHHEMDQIEKDWKESAVITETKSPTSELLPEMRIRAPWVEDDRLE
jgi:hypothetical protein